MYITLCRPKEVYLYFAEDIKMNRSKLMNRYTKWPSRENFLAFKKQKNICKNFNKKTKKNYFSKIT